MASSRLTLTGLFGLVLLTNQVLSMPMDPTEGPTNSHETAEQADGEASNGVTKGIPLKELLGENKLDVDDDDQYDEYDNDHELCPLCRDDFSDKPALDIQCGHKYHLDCLKQYDGVTNGLEKCFLCFKDMRTMDGKLLTDAFYEEARTEVIKNKLKMGVMASYRWKPQRWDERPKTWREDGLYW